MSDEQSSKSYKIHSRHDCRTGRLRARVIDIEGMADRAAGKVLNGKKCHILARHGGSVCNSYGYPAESEVGLVIAFRARREVHVVCYANQIAANKITMGGAAAACLSAARPIFDDRFGAEAKADARKEVYRLARNEVFCKPEIAHRRAKARQILTPLSLYGRFTAYLAWKSGEFGADRKSLEQDVRDFRIVRGYPRGKWYGDRFLRQPGSWRLVYVPFGDQRDWLAYQVASFIESDVIFGRCGVRVLAPPISVDHAGELYKAKNGKKFLVVDGKTFEAPKQCCRASDAVDMIIGRNLTGDSLVILDAKSETEALVPA